MRAVSSFVKLLYKNIFFLERNFFLGAKPGASFLIFAPMNGHDDVGPARQKGLSRVRCARFCGMVRVGMENPHLIEPRLFRFQNFFEMLFRVDDEFEGSLAPHPLRGQGNRTLCHELFQPRVVPAQDVLQFGNARHAGRSGIDGFAEKEPADFAGIAFLAQLLQLLPLGLFEIEFSHSIPKCILASSLAMVRGFQGGVQTRSILTSFTMGRVRSREWTDDMI